VDLNISKSKDKNPRFFDSKFKNSVIENSSLINCENIKISLMPNNEEVEIEKDSLEFVNKENILTNSINLTCITEFIKKDSEETDKKEFFYGSPAIWLKNKNKFSKGKKSSSLFSNRSFSKVGSGIKSFSQRLELFNNTQSNFSVNTASTSPLKVNKKTESPVILKNKYDEKQKNLPIYQRHQSFLEAFNNRELSRTRNSLDENSFRTNTINDKNNHFKTLINNKLQIMYHENKFNNIMLRSKHMNTTDKVEKTEIDEIIVNLKLITILFFRIRKTQIFLLFKIKMENY